MAETAEQAAREVIEDYLAYTGNFMKEHGDRVRALAAEVDAAGFDRASDYFFDVTEDLKSKYGAGAANKVEDAEAQEAAIGIVESWVAENVANAGTEANVLCAMWGYGPDEVERGVRAELSSAPSA